MPVVFARARLPSSRRRDLERPEFSVVYFDRGRDGDEDDEEKTCAKPARAIRGEKQTIACADCSQAVRASALRAHAESVCPFRIVECGIPGCKVRVPHADLEWHRKIDCLHGKRQRRLILHGDHHRKKEASKARCESCGEEFPIAHAQTHAWECPEKRVACPNVITGCLASVKASALEDHLRNECKLEAHRRELARQFREKEASGLTCDACGQKGIHPRAWRRHKLDACRMRLVVCPLKCGREEIVWQDLGTHLEEACPRQRKRDELLASSEAKTATSFRCTMGCGARIPEACMPGHVKRECERRFVACECGHAIRIKDRAAHQRQDLVYTVHRVARCAFAVRREGLAAISLARDRLPEKVVCPNQCGAEVTHKTLRDHLAHACGNRLVRCRFTHIQCGLAGKLVRAADIARHEQEECAGAAAFRQQIEAGQRHKALEACPRACGVSFPHAQLRAHVDFACELRPVPCRLGCGQLVAARVHDAHTRSGECPRAARRDVLAILARGRAAQKSKDAEAAKIAAEAAAAEEAAAAADDSDYETDSGSEPQASAKEI